MKESEERYRSLVEDSQEGIWALDINENTTFVNPRICEMLGYTKDEMMGKNLHLLIPDSMEERIKGNRIRREKGIKETYDLELLKKDGTTIYTNIKAAPIMSESREYKGSFAYITDITNRKKAEQKLKESEEKFRKQTVFLNNILESLTHPFYVINADDYTIALANFTASSEGLKLGKHCYSLTHNNDKPCEAPCKCPLEEVKKTKRACVVEHTHYDREGKAKTYEIYGYPILDESGNVVQMIEYALNISDRKKAEKNLRKIAQQWRTTFDAMSESVFLLDLEQNILQCNKAMLDLLGKENYEEIIGHSCCEIMHCTKEPVEWCPMIRMIESNHKESSIAQLGDKWCEISVDPVINDEGTLIGAVHIITDITERRKINQKLRESEEIARNIINNISDVLMEGNIDGTITYISHQIYDINGYQSKELIGFNFLEFIHPEEKNIYEKLINEHQKAGDKFSMELRVLHRKGYYVPISVKSSLVEVNNKLKIFVVIRDITEKRKIDNMMKSEIKKLKDLDQIRSDLIRRISHELKTPLISIFSGSQYLLDHSNDIIKDQTQRIIQLIYMGGYRLKNLVDNLILTYNIESKELNLNLKRKNIIQIIKNCIEDIVFQAKKRKIFINIELLKELFIEVDKSMIKRAISNILSNAVKNTPTNGNIFISTFEHPNYIDIIVKDDGVGLIKKEISVLFKRFGKIERYGKGMDVDIEGAGLGLYIANEIVELHYGEIIVKSKGRNKGSTFIIRLPIK